MRKLKLQIQVSIDGFVAGPKGQLDWMTWNWDEPLMEFVKELTDSIDTILMGRKMSEGFIPHWETVVKDPKNPEYEGGVKYTSTPKIVFTKTLNKSTWNNTEIENGELVEEITNLKNKAFRSENSWRSQ